MVISWLENERVLDERVTGRTPVPVNDAICGLLGALSVMVSVPETVPLVVGENVTEIVQVALAARVLGDIGQFEVWPKVPDVEMLEIVSGAD